MRTEPDKNTALSLFSALRIGVWFGVLAGLAEGAGLLLFQRINWARWGPMIHVSEEILWISPLVDLVFFLTVTLFVYLLSCLIRRISGYSTLVFLLAFLSIHDWLTLTGRLDHRACLLLALGVAAAFVRWFGKRKEVVLRFWERTSLFAIVCLVLAFVGIQGGRLLAEKNAVAHLPAASTGSPNVLVIVVDTLRADHLSLYGYPRPTSPNIDQLAAQGVTFQNAIATSSWSLPSHVSLLTGRYVSEHGVGSIQPAPWLGWGKDGLGGHRSLGEVLQERGYRTGAFSANRTYFSANLGFGRSFIHFEDYFHSPADMLVRTLYGREFARLYLNRSDKSKVKRALRWMGMNSLLDKDSEGSGTTGGAQGVRKRASVVNQETLHWIDRDPQRPFFVFLNYFDVHYPYGGPANYPRPDWDHGKRGEQYDTSVKYVDDQIGQLISELDRRGLSQNTLVVITSDHGESLGEHGLTYHGASLYRELVQVPLIVRYPGHAPAGLHVQQPVTNAAIPATIMDLIHPGGTAVFPIPALNVLWEGPDTVKNWPHPLSELSQNTVLNMEDRSARSSTPTSYTGSMKSLVTPQWHLITHSKGVDQLYDWANDPEELNDRAPSAEGGPAVSSLKKEIDGTLSGSKK